MNYFEKITDSIIKLRDLIELALREAIAESEDHSVQVDNCFLPVYDAKQRPVAMEVTFIYLKDDRVCAHYNLWSQPEDELIDCGSADINEFNVAELDQIYTNLLNDD